uniref:CCHC-type domain-containing protein n=1 Tax=Caenorhabditis japonica TaxID=281687 RepID=A0A8R1I831_CAEJA
MRGLRPATDRLEALEERVTHNTSKLDALLLNTAPTQQVRERHDSSSGSGSASTRSPQQQYHVNAAAPPLEESSVREAFLTYLSDFARDKAEELLELSPKCSCKQLVDEMRKTFEDPNRADMKKQQLRQCLQHVNESVDDFSNRVPMKFEMLFAEAARASTILPQGLAVMPAPALTHQPKKAKGECFYCGIPGHFANECRRRVKDRANGIFRRENKTGLTYLY